MEKFDSEIFKNHKKLVLTNFNNKNKQISEINKKFEKLIWDLYQQ